MSCVSLEDARPSPMDAGAEAGDCDDKKAAEHLGAVRMCSRECYACGEQG